MEDVQQNLPDPPSAAGQSAGNMKVTRDEWLSLARDTLIEGGVDQVKIMTLAHRLGVSRSSFYWYFTNRQDLLDALLTEWATRNTSQIVTHCHLPAKSISHAVCNFFRCFVDPDLFDSRLEFAVREWARRDASLSDGIRATDTKRIAAMTDMFVRHGYAAPEADARARILYFMQLGYHALGVSEPMTIRMSRLEEYTKGFIGSDPDQDAIAALVQFIRDRNLR